MATVIYTNNKCVIPFEEEHHESILAILWDDIKNNYKPTNIKNWYKLIKKIKKADEIKNAVKDFLEIKEKFDVRKYVNGKHYLIIRGKAAGLRKYVKGVWYKGSSPQQVTLGIVKKNLTKGLTSKVVYVSLLINTGDKISEYLLKDSWLWSDFLSDLGLDIAKDLAAATLGAGAGLLTVAALAKIATLGVAVPLVAGALPIAIAVTAGFYAGKGFALLIEKHKMKEALAEAMENAAQPIKEWKKQVDDTMIFYYQEVEKEIFRLYNFSPKLMGY